MATRSSQGVSLNNHLLILAVLSLAFFWSDGDDTGVHAVEFYTRYPEYPPYCSTPEEVAKRNIPPLSTSAKLLHVTAIFRHGARTPWGPGLNCWEEYHSDPVTSVWDCNLTADSAPPIPQRAAEEGANVVDMEGEDGSKNVWFEKRYDALKFPQYNLSNELNGTCQVGQLIDQGYSQEIANGKFLREAYATPNATVRYLPMTHKDIYFRVDDEPRTVMSGQLVIRGLLGSVEATIPLHTADFDRDIVDPNEKICPRLGEIAKANRNSAEYQAFLSEHQSLRDFQRDVLKPPQANRDMHAIDCLMTTMCTDRPLPDAVNDYRSDISDEWDDQYGPNRFQRLYEYDVQKYTMNLKANDAEFAKIGMGPLWYEILQQIRPVLNGQSDYPKMHIVSGHDTTVMPLLAALDPKLWPDKEWPSYASMIALELYTMNDDDGDSFFFRLVYNGKILTPSGCDSNNELCDMQVLLDRVEPFAIPNPDCQPHDMTPPSPGNAPTTSIDTESTSTSTTVNSFGSLFFVVGAILGALVTHIVHRRCGGGVSNATPLPSDDHDGIMRDGRLARHDDDGDDNNSLI